MKGYTIQKEYKQRFFEFLEPKLKNMDTNKIKKISRRSFEEQFEIIFGKEQTLNSGTNNVLFNQKQAFLKNRKTGEIVPTNIFASSEELGELLVIEAFCDSE